MFRPGTVIVGGGGGGGGDIKLSNEGDGMLLYNNTTKRLNRVLDSDSIQWITTPNGNGIQATSNSPQTDIKDGTITYSELEYSLQNNTSTIYNLNIDGIADYDNIVLLRNLIVSEDTHLRTIIINLESTLRKNYSLYIDNTNVQNLIDHGYSDINIKSTYKILLNRNYFVIN